MSQVIELPTASVALPVVVERPRQAVNGPTVQLIQRVRGRLIDFMPKNPAAKHFAAIAHRYDQSLTTQDLREIEGLGFVIEVDGVRV